MANIVIYSLMGLLTLSLVASYVVVGCKIGNLYTNNELSKHLQIAGIVTGISVFFWTVIIFVFFSINTKQAIPYLIINQGLLYFFVLTAVALSTITKLPGSN